ncbi:hypothetical protein GGF50DRAFT_130366 [Schizophyllum commune]
MARTYTSKVIRQGEPLNRRSRRTQPMTPAQIAMYSNRYLPDYTDDRCDACGELAKKTIDKVNHWKVHLPAASPGWKMFRRGYECYFCPETHQVKDDLVSHLACHQYVLFALFRVLSTASTLRIAFPPYHLHLMLPSNPKPPPPETTDSTNSFPSLRYPCPGCPKTYSNRGNLSVHRTAKHGYVPKPRKAAKAVESDASPNCEVDERTTQEDVAPMSAAPVAGDMVGLSRMPLDLPADAPTPLYCLSATGQHSQGETPYATEDASLPGLVDNTTPGLEHDLSHASGSTTPLMTPPPPHCAESFDAHCDAGYGQSSGHGFDLPVLGDCNQIFNPYLAGLHVGNFPRGIPAEPLQEVYPSHPQPSHARNSTWSRTSQPRRPHQHESVKFADFGFSNTDSQTTNRAFAGPMYPSALCVPPASSISLANAPRSMGYPPVSPPHRYTESTMHPEGLPAARASQNGDFQPQQWALSTTQRPEFLQQQTFAPQSTDWAFVQQQEQDYVDPHALDFTAADAMDVAASYAIDFTDVYSSWHDFGDAIVP